MKIDDGSIRIRRRSPSRTEIGAPIPVSSSPDEVPGRLSRFGQIRWWDYDIVRKARIMVVGAGALGNETIKNLGLMGIGRILVVDFDVIDDTNLSRSVLYREGDVGEPKAIVASCRITDINPAVKSIPLVANVLGQVGTGLFKEFDLVIGAVDSREARLAINRACWKVGIPYVDGGLGVLTGVVKVFVPPDSPCYECTLTPEDFRLLPQRQSCGLLKRNVLENAGVPTTPISASIVGAMQAQEALKLIHGANDWKQLAGEAYEYDGLRFEALLVRFQKTVGDDECSSHDTYDQLVPLPGSSDDVSVRQLLEYGKDSLGEGCIIDLAREILQSLECNICGQGSDIFKPLALYTSDDALCPDCGGERQGNSFHSLDSDSGLLDRSLSELGLPPMDVYTLRHGLRRIHMLPYGDKPLVLGESWNLDPD